MTERRTQSHGSHTLAHPGSVPQAWQSFRRWPASAAMKFRSKSPICKYARLFMYVELSSLTRAQVHQSYRVERQSHARLILRFGMIVKKRTADYADMRG